MRVPSALLVGICILPIALADHRPKLGAKCKHKGITACAIDRSHVLRCDGASWIINERGVCDPGCCAKTEDGHDNIAYCLRSPDKNCLNRHDTSSDDDDTHIKRSMKRRDLRRPRPSPSLHKVDTRCNPLDFTSIQRATPDHNWVHHFTCEYKGQCKDIDGHGACYLGNSLYLVPSGNETTEYYQNGTLKVPSRLRTDSHCNPANPYESLKFNGTDYAVDGICHEPFVCFDFGGKAGFTFCHHPNDTDLSRYLPWPVDPNIPAGISSDAKVARCYNDQELQTWDGKKWNQYMNCTRGFTCHSGADDSGMAGCSLLYQSEMWMGHDYEPERLPPPRKRSEPEPLEDPIDSCEDFCLAKKRQQYSRKCYYWQDENGTTREWCDAYDNDTSDDD